MNMESKNALLLLAGLGMALTSHAASPWLPAAGTHQIGFSFSQQSADQFYVGETEMDLPTDLTLDALQLDYSYGLSDRLALDVQLLYAESDFLVDPGLAPNGGLDGIGDARIGLRWLALEEIAGFPVTLTLNVAAIIEGDYDTGAITAIGDGASGGELSVITGRSFDSGLSWATEVGFRARGGEVPNEWFFNRSVSYGFNDRFSGRLAWNSVDSRGNLDIGAPGFSPARFPALEEDYDLWLIGASFAPTFDWTLGIDVGRKFDGRNTAKSDIVALSISRSF